MTLKHTNIPTTVSYTSELSLVPTQPVSQEKVDSATATTPSS